MTWTLLRQDPAWRIVGIWVPLAVFCGLLVRVTGADLDRVFARGLMGHQNLGLTILLVTVWATFFIFLVNANIWTRCSRLSLGLPVSARSLWLIRIVSIVGAGFLVLSALAFTLAVGEGENGGGLALDPFSIGLVVHLGATIVLCSLLFQLPGPELRRLSGSRYLTYAIIIAGGGLFHFLFVPAWIPLDLGMLVIAGAVGLWVYRRLPDGFVTHARDGHLTVLVPEATAVPDQPLSQPARVRGEISIATESNLAPAASGGPLLRHVTIWRLLHNRWTSWVVVLALFLYGNGMAHSYNNGRSPVLYATIAVGMLWGLASQAVPRLRRLEPWPLRGRLLFAHLVLPGLAALALGYGVWQLGAQGTPARNAQVKVNEGRLHLPPEFRQIAWDGVVPEIGSPWGESYRPEARTLPLGSRIAVFDPFAWGPESSPKFMALQIDRAVERVWGKPIPPSALEFTAPLPDHYQCCLEEGRFTLPEWRGRPVPERRKVLACSCVLYVLLAAGVFLIGLQGFRPASRGRLYLIAMVGILVTLVLLMVAGDIAQGRGFDSLRNLGLLLVVRFQEFATALPLTEGAVWGVAAVAVVVGYLLAQRKFRTIETGCEKPARLAEKY